MFVVNALSRISILFWSLLLFIFVVQFSSAAGSGLIKGHVFDKVTGEPLIGANIVIQNTSLGVAADVDGGYVLRLVPVGEWTLNISYLGYKSFSMHVIITEDVVIEKDFTLEPQSIQGEEVVVTAQARGQQAAINQQLMSNTISSIVSSDRIKELPDASAAESIGRLPGVSIDRYNGEATSVAIRGLAPKYNTVTVNGVALPATNNNDRSVDLSLISSNVLDGIEVKKANTPDMDADALGGTIDLRLKEAPAEFLTTGSFQGGYSGLNKYYGNYNANVGISDRFFDNNLGVMFNVNADKNNRDADKLNAAYVPGASSGTAQNQLVLSTFNTERDDSYKDRVGGNLLLDYSIPNGKLTGNGFYNQATTFGSTRQDLLDIGHSSHYYNLEDNNSKTSLYTSSIGASQDFGWIKYDASISATGSSTSNPNDYRWQFSQENGAVPGAAIGASTPLTSVDSIISGYIVPKFTGLKSLFIYSTWLFEKDKTAQFNFQIPFKVSNDINGFIKTGGKFKWLARNFNQEQWGHDNLQYGGSWSVNTDAAHAAAIAYPNDYNIASDSTLMKQTGYWNMYRFDDGYALYSNFLKGQYTMGSNASLKLMHELTNVWQNLGSRDWQRISIGSMGSDYDGIEEYQAGYIMAEIELGQYISLIPGVRYDADYTKYNGESFQATNSGGVETPPVGFQINTNERSNSFWLPMVHLKLHPLNWLRIHLAGTETVTRPDYSQYAPITSLDTYGGYCQAANGGLRDSRSKNLDASVSIFHEYAGLVTVSGFYKSIDDLIMYESIASVDTIIYKKIDAQLNVPSFFFQGNRTPTIATWLNNSSPAQYRGVEFEWQTNFWYLPQPLSGLVFNINWTYINSTITVKQYVTKSYYIPARPAPIKVSTYDSTSRAQRMPDQPAHILNGTIGYDYKGFSLRVSYIYQSNKVISIGSSPVLDTYTGSYNRWDIAVQQKLGSHLQLYANINNLTNTNDATFGSQQIDPISEQYYGTSVDVGLRYNF